MTEIQLPQVLLPSGRNSLLDNIALFEQTKCACLFYSHPFQSKASDLQRAGFDAMEVPSFDQMLTGDAKHYRYMKTWELAHRDPIIICHTSGSTGTNFRKPVPAC